MLLKKLILVIFLIYNFALIGVLNVMATTQRDKDTSISVECSQVEDKINLQEEVTLVTKIFKVKHIKIGTLVNFPVTNKTLLSLLLSNLSQKGELGFDFRTNQLIITDTPEILDKIEIIIQNVNIFTTYYQSSKGRFLVPCKGLVYVILTR